MSTRSLLVWAALVAGAELAVRGYVGGDVLACHGGAALFAAGLAGLALGARRRGLRRLARFGLGTAALLLAAAAVDAAFSYAGGRPPSPASLPASGGSGEAPVATSPASGRGAPRPGDAVPPRRDGTFRIALVGGGPGSAATPGAARLEAALHARLACERHLEVLDAGDPEDLLGGDAAALARWGEAAAPDLLLVRAGGGVLDALLEEAPALRFPPAAPLPARGSAGIAALEDRLRRASRERRWRVALATEAPLELRGSPLAARYRERVLAARRRGIAVVLAIPALAPAPEIPQAVLRERERAQPDLRSHILADRHHARLVRGIAGSYGLPVVDARAAAGADDALAAALAPRLAGPRAGCRPREAAPGG